MQQRTRYPCLLVIQNHHDSIHTPPQRISSLAPSPARPHPSISNAPLDSPLRSPTHNQIVAQESQGRVEANGEIQRRLLHADVDMAAESLRASTGGVLAWVDCAWRGLVGLGQLVFVNDTVSVRRIFATLGSLMLLDVGAE